MTSWIIRSSMVSPDAPSPIKKVDPSPIKKVESFGSSPVRSMGEKLRMVRSVDCQAPAPMPSREPMRRISSKAHRRGGNYFVEEPVDSKLHVSMKGYEDANLSASERKPRSTRPGGCCTWKGRLRRLYETGLSLDPSIFEPPLRSEFRRNKILKHKDGNDTTQQTATL